MAARRHWVRSPERGGKRVPEAVQQRVAARLQRYASQHFAGRYTQLDLRFRGQFCYVDAYTELQLPGPSWPPPDWPETREEYVERLRTTPYTSAACAISATRSVGGSRSTRTAASAMRCPSSPPGSSLGRRRRPSRWPLRRHHYPAPQMDDSSGQCWSWLGNSERPGRGKPAVLLTLVVC